MLIQFYDVQKIVSIDSLSTDFKIKGSYDVESLIQTEK